MKVRFLADYDFNGEISDGLLRREPSVDLKSGYEAELLLVWSASEVEEWANRVLYLPLWEASLEYRRKAGRVLPATSRTQILGKTIHDCLFVNRPHFFLHGIRKLEVPIRHRRDSM